MFRDPSSVKIRNILLPFLLWVAAGMVAELLAVPAALFLGKAAGFQAALSYAHEEWELWLVLFRAAAVIPFFARFMKADGERIRTELIRLPEDAVLPERREFFERRSGFRVQELLAIPAGVFYMLFMSLVLSGLGLQDVDSVMHAPSAGIPGLCLMVLLEVFLGPLSEELLLRGLIYRRLRTFTKPALSKLISALFFAILHWNAAQMLYAFFLGIVLSDLYESSGRLRTAFFAHAAANLGAVLLGILPEAREWIFRYPGGVTVVSGVLFFGCLFCFVYLFTRERASVS